MNDDRIIGAGRDLLGKAERGIGDATGSDRLQGDGMVDQVTGAVQHGYGIVKDKVGDLVEDAPGAMAGAVSRTRELGRQGDEAVRERLGDNGPLYLLGGAIALLALGAFAISRSAPSQAPKPKPQTKPASKRRTRASATTTD